MVHDGTTFPRPQGPRYSPAMHDRDPASGNGHALNPAQRERPVHSKVQPHPDHEPELLVGLAAGQMLDDWQFDARLDREPSLRELQSGRNRLSRVTRLTFRPF